MSEIERVMMARYLEKHSEYTDVELLSYGFEGTVFKCKNKENKTVALKIINRDPSIESEKIKHEMLIHKKLKNDIECPVAFIYDMKLLPDYLVFEMEYFQGIELLEFMLDFDKFSPEKIYVCADIMSSNTCGYRSSVSYYLAIKIFEALVCIHSKGIVHRDIKPENIMLKLTGNPQDPFNVVFIDFGMSNMIDDDISSLRELKGTLVYTHPYVLDKNPKVHSITTALEDDVWGLLVFSDIWSVASTVYSILTGSALVDSEDTGYIDNIGNPIKDTASVKNIINAYRDGRVADAINQQLTRRNKDACSKILLGLAHSLMTRSFVDITSSEILKYLNSYASCNTHKIIRKSPSIVESRSISHRFTL